MLTPHKVNVGFYGLLQRFVSVYYVTSTYLSIFRSTKIKTQNKYKLSVRAKSPRTFSPTQTLYKTVVQHYPSSLNRELKKSEKLILVIIIQMKYSILLTLLFFTLSCHQTNKEFEIDSPEAIARLNSDLKLTKIDIAKEINYWLDIDSSAVAYFKTDSTTILRVIKRLQMEHDTIQNYIWIPENSPGWFRPSIDPDRKKNNTWIKIHSDKKIFLQLNEEQNECFFANIK
jgi:hypothetical protein